MKNTGKNSGSGRFAAGNRAAVGNRGGGRPRAPYREQLERYSEESLGLLWEVANDPEHPWHAAHGFQAARELARICTPRLSQLEAQPEAGALTFLDLARAMTETEARG